MRAAILLLACGLSCGALGCGGGGGGTVTAEGKVVKAGAPYSLAEGEGISINLHGDKSAGGTVGKDGTFKIEKIPPGKYKVSYTHYVPLKGKDVAPPTTKNTDQVWDLTSDKKDLVLDISGEKK